MKKILFLFAIFILFSSFLQDNVVVPEKKLVVEPIIEPIDESVSMIFAGDIMGHSPQFQAAYNAKTNSFDYDVCFIYVKPYIEKADFAIANLEVPLAGKPYSGYPNFSSPDALLDGLKNAGYDVMLTANNHVADRSKPGLERTLRTIEGRNLKHAGSYLNKAQKDSIYPLILEKNGFKIALLNYTYGTNGIKVQLPNIVNLIDTLEIKNDIRKAEQIADFTVLTVHWGTEYELKANDFQRNLTKMFVREGVDLVVGGHPHVVQDAEYIAVDTISVPVFYSLGNSISNQRKANTDGGIMLQVKIDVKSKKLIETSYVPVYVHKGQLDAVFQYHLIPTPVYFKLASKFNLSIKDSLTLTYFDKQTRKRIPNFNVMESSNNENIPINHE